MVNRVNFGKSLCGITSGPEEIGIICEFSDGSKAGPFDMVVGCDGINSAVKEYINRGKISSIQSGEGTNVPKNAIYSGIRIQYAVQDGAESDPDVNSADLCQYFGDGAYALGSIYGAGWSSLNSSLLMLIFISF